MCSWFRISVKLINHMITPHEENIPIMMRTLVFAFFVCCLYVSTYQYHHLRSHYVSLVAVGRMRQLLLMVAMISVNKDAKRKTPSASFALTRRWEREEHISWPDLREDEWGEERGDDVLSSPHPVAAIIVLAVQKQVTTTALSCKHTTHTAK